MRRGRACWQLLLLALISGAVLGAVVLEGLLGSKAIHGNGAFFSTLSRQDVAAGREASSLEQDKEEQLVKEEGGKLLASAQKSGGGDGGNLYHDWGVFERDLEMMQTRLRIFVYPDAFNKEAAFSKVFTPHPDPYHRKLRNYFSEHIFKRLLLNSTFLTPDPAKASLFFLPFSTNVLRNDPRVKEEAAIARFVAEYVSKVSQEFPFWNRSKGADHFYVCCHSVCRSAMAGSPDLRRNAIQATCSANVYHRHYVAHKDVSWPQIWPRDPEPFVASSSKRPRLAFYAGRQQNSVVRKELMQVWKEDPDMDLYEGVVGGSYEEHFRTSKFCLHVRGYEVNTARLSDAIHFGCVPVILSNYYDLPWANVLDWKQLAVLLNHRDLHLLKASLIAVSQVQYTRMSSNVRLVQRHFRWNNPPQPYDAFFMSLYQLWLRKRDVL